MSWTQETWKKMKVTCFWNKNTLYLNICDEIEQLSWNSITITLPAECKTFVLEMIYFQIEYGDPFMKHTMEIYISPTHIHT